MSYKINMLPCERRGPCEQSDEPGPLKTTLLSPSSPTAEISTTVFPPQQYLLKIWRKGKYIK